MERSLLDLGPRARVAFALGYVAVMLAVVISAQSRPDRVFGFQMFNESSKVTIHLYRRVEGQRGLVPLVNGAFESRDRAGHLRRYDWHARVRDPVLGRLDTQLHAKYGLAGQLFRLKLALKDFAAELRDDVETKELVAVVETLKNGRNPAIVRFKAAPP